MVVSIFLRLYSWPVYSKWYIPLRTTKSAARIIYRPSSTKHFFFEPRVQPIASLDLHICDQNTPAFQLASSCSWGKHILSLHYLEQEVTTLPNPQLYITSNLNNPLLTPIPIHSYLLIKKVYRHTRASNANENLHHLKGCYIVTSQIFFSSSIIWHFDHYSLHAKWLLPLKTTSLKRQYSQIATNILCTRLSTKSVNRHST